MLPELGYKPVNQYLPPRAPAEVPPHKTALQQLVDKMIER
jgi:hypothetical protein